MNLRSFLERLIIHTQVHGRFLKLSPCGFAILASVLLESFFERRLHVFINSMDLLPIAVIAFSLVCFLQSLVRIAWLFGLTEPWQGSLVKEPSDGFYVRDNSIFRYWLSTLITYLVHCLEDSLGFSEASGLTKFSGIDRNHDGSNDECEEFHSNFFI